MPTSRTTMPSSLAAATCDGVISVGAVDSENNIANYSALDARTVIYAPGGGQRLAGDAPWRVNKLKVGTYDLDFKGDETPAASFRGDSRPGRTPK